MARITWLDDRLRNDGSLTVREKSGWTTRERPGSFAPEGVLIHHTGARASFSDPTPSLNTVINGRPDLAGPLCHVLIGWDGVCHIVAAGRANHAGTALASGPMPAGDGNTMYVGIEVDYAPQDPYFQQPQNPQLIAAINAAAAIVTKLGHGNTYVRYHKETSTTGKWDPGNFPSASEFRSLVQSRIQSRY